MPDIRNDGSNYSNKTEGGVRKPDKPKLDAAKEHAEKYVAAHAEDFAPRSQPKPESKKIGGTRAER